MGIKIEQFKEKKVEGSGSSLEGILKKDINLFGKSFSNKKKEQFYAELGVLLKSGINLKQALDLISESQTKEKDRALSLNLSQSITEGMAFAEALEKDKSFSVYECKAIEIGEQTGQLAFIAEDLAEYYRKKNDQKREIISSLTYPIIVLFTAVLVVFFMLSYVVPMFEDIFKQNNVELPFLTQMVVKASLIIELYGLELLICIIFLSILLKIGSKKIWFKRYSGNLLLKLPVIGTYARKIYMARFTHTMMLLTNSKIPVINALGMVRDMISFYPLKDSLEKIEAEILRGERMSDSFKNHPIFDNKIIALLKVAEETNQTEYVFRKLYDQYSKEVEYQAKTITNVLNPLLTLFVGFIVGVILIAMYLPMFRLSSVIG